jgi:RNA-directed DNA polymerase
MGSGTGHPVAESFDNINHDFLLESIGQAPGRGLLRQWLKAGIMQDGVFHETPLSTPQGGVITPPTIWQTAI